MKVTFIGGYAPHYETGLMSGLLEHGIEIEAVGGDELAAFAVVHSPGVQFRNLHGKNDPNAPGWLKLLRVLRVYLRLMLLALRTDSRLVHIQWPYKLVFLDRTVLNLWYKLLGKRLLFTAHNVDADARDGTSSWAKRSSLKFMYWIVDHIIVHTTKMRDQLVTDFGLPPLKISVIPHGVMTALPETAMTVSQARERLGLGPEERVLLFFGSIVRYKGLDHLVEAIAALRDEGKKYRMVIGGEIKGGPDYWNAVQDQIDASGLRDQTRIDVGGYIPDEEVETYFKAADVLVLPYRDIFQSGVLFLAYRFGLPVIATDVGSFKEELQSARAGLVCRPNDPIDLARAIEDYFKSDLYLNLSVRRQEIRAYASEHFSWRAIGAQTRKVYQSLLGETPVMDARPAAAVAKHDWKQVS